VTLLGGDEPRIVGGFIRADNIRVGTISADTLGWTNIDQQMRDAFPQVSVRRGGINYNTALQNPLRITYTPDDDTATNDDDVQRPYWTGGPGSTSITWEAHTVTPAMRLMWGQPPYGQEFNAETLL